MARRREGKWKTSAVTRLQACYLRHHDFPFLWIWICICVDHVNVPIYAVLTNYVVLREAVLWHRTKQVWSSLSHQTIVKYTLFALLSAGMQSRVPLLLRYFKSTSARKNVARWYVSKPFFKNPEICALVFLQYDYFNERCVYLVQNICSWGKYVQSWPL